MNELENQVPVEDTLQQSGNADETASCDQTPAALNYHQMTREELIAALRGVIESGNMEAHHEVAAIKQAYYSLLNRDAVARLQEFVEAGNDPESYSAQPEETEAEIKLLFNEFREKRAAYLELVEATLQANLEKKNGIISKLQAIVEDIDNINMKYPEFQALQQEFKGVGDVPPGADADVWKSFQGVVEQFYDRLKMNKELRDLDFKKNLEVKESIIKKAETLSELPDPIEAFRNLQGLHVQWRETGPVAKDVRDGIWNRFKEISTVINKRHQDYFEERKAGETENEAKKIAICEKVEGVDVTALRSFADWDAKTKEIIELQKEYKGIGFASKKANAELFARFRKACDAFFTAKAEHFRKTKDEFRENLAKKEELIAKAEALVEKALEKSSLDSLRALQDEWKKVGVVRRKYGEEVWKRFNLAIDAFHAARKAHYGEQRNAENENLSVKQAIVEELKAISEESERKEVIGKIRELQDKWQQTGHVPFKHKEALQEAYRGELNRLFSAFDNRENNKRMRKFENDVKKMEGDSKGLGRERERLQKAMESRQNEIKTIENNLGFFKFKASENNPMLKDFERKIQKLKDEIVEIKEKIKLLENK